MRAARAAHPAAPRRVLLTRSDEDNTAWATELERRGFGSVALPCIAAEPIDSPALRARLAEASARADWIVFTSRRGVDAYARLTDAAPAARARIAAAGAAQTGQAAQAAGAAQGAGATQATQATQAAGTKIAVVGAGTAGAAREQLGRVDLVGEGGTAEALAASLIRHAGLGAEAGVQTARHSGTAARARPPADDYAAAAADAPEPHATAPTIVLALAANARDTLERSLGAAGFMCRRFDVYRTVPAAVPKAGKRPLSSLGVDAVWLASPSAATGFANQVDVDGAARIVTIGPSTTRAARERGLPVAAEAREPSLDGLLQALERSAP